ncbi:MAG: hypothetical protein NC122_07100 [Faecalibacterium sp.]|nr:hypothetical protein [Ruminococcus sp.]MCM1392254.1 hypothetical protein [Ruminococcus sp.]MCM1485958.1 hypothetical protein [Faecalibacterium sp.]
MQTIDLVLNGKKLKFSRDKPKKITVVGDNKDYFIHFQIDEIRKAMFAVFVRDGKEESVIINDTATVNIPLWLLKQGSFSVGITSDGFASTPVYIIVKGSIIDQPGIETETPPPSQVEQLIKLVNDLQMKGIDEEEMKRLIGEYLKENHISPDDLPIATKSTLGIVKIGDGLLVDKVGTVSVDIAKQIEADNTRPISSAMAFMEIGNISALLGTI